MWIGEQPCMQMDFWRFCRKKHIGQHSWKIVSNPFACIVVLQSIGKGPFLFQKVWDIFFSFNTLKYLFPRIREPQNIQICVIPVKLSEIHLHSWLFSNSQGKVLFIVGISFSPDLRVQHINLYFIQILKGHDSDTL